MRSFFRRLLRKRLAPPSTAILQPIEALQSESADSEAIFEVRSAFDPWGDYGHIVIHGMASSRAENGQLRLARTGPVMPPITFPSGGHTIVTDEMRRCMVAAGFRGVSYRPVIKEHIIEIHWEHWDWGRDEPGFYPPGGEPEFYFNRAHSERASIPLGDLWELILVSGVDLEKVLDPHRRHSSSFKALRGSRNDADIFFGKMSSIRYCSVRAKLWFERHVPAWVRFADVDFKDPETAPPPRAAEEALRVEAAIVLFAARNSVMKPDAIREWALYVVEREPSPPIWLIELSTSPMRLADDTFAVLDAHAAKLSLRNKLQTIMHARVKNMLTLNQALATLFRVAVTDELAIGHEDEALVEALIDWDLLEDVDAIPQELSERLRDIFKQYLKDAPDIEKFVR